MDVAVIADRLDTQIFLRKTAGLCCLFLLIFQINVTESYLHEIKVQKRERKLYEGAKQRKKQENYRKEKIEKSGMEKKKNQGPFI